MTMQSDQPSHRAEAQRREWDRVAQGWQRWWRTIEDGAQGISERMLDLARIRPGQRVLDLATGIGEPALSAARRVGPEGRVVATDISPQMLDIARERAAASGLTNVEFIQADARTLDFADGRFDAVLCRWGVTSLPDPHGVLVAIRRWLAPEGSFVTCVWQSGAKGRPMASLAAAVARDLFDLPPEQAPTASSAQAPLQEQMQRVGFAEVRIETASMVLAFRSAADCTGYLKDVSPEFSALLSAQSPQQQAEFARRLAEALRPYTGADGGVRIPNESLCALGRG